MNLSTIVCISFTITLSFYRSVDSTVVNFDKPISCDGAVIKQVRIANCVSEPCRIVKGRNLSLEIDFSFKKSTSTDPINFSVAVHYWGVGSPFVSYFARGSKCSELLPESTCPAKTGVQHKLRSNLYVDPKSADSLTGAKTGKRFTTWSLSTPTAQDSHSTCSFSVALDIVEG